MKLVTGYFQFPGKCFFTGSSDTSDGVIDMEHDVDWEGRVYLRGSLAKEMAAALGWIAPEERDRLEARIAELEVQNAALASVLDAADALDATAKVVTDALVDARATVSA